MVKTAGEVKAAPGERDAASRLANAIDPGVIELKAAPGERDVALEKLDAFRKEAEARREEDMYTIASLRAWAELAVGGGAWGGAGGGGGGGRGWIPSGAHVNDVFSSPPLAVQTALAARAAQEAGAAAAQGAGASRSRSSCYVKNAG